MAIISRLDRIHTYFETNEKLHIVFNYSKSAITSSTEENKRISSLPIGAFDRFYLSDDIFAIEQVYRTKSSSKCFFESHRNYVDFQLVICGTEQMEVIDITKMKAKKKYNNAKDLIIYHDTDRSSKIVLSNSDIAVFFPEDAHMGLSMFIQEELIRKTCVKIPIKYFKNYYSLEVK